MASISFMLEQGDNRQSPSVPAGSALGLPQLATGIGFLSCLALAIYIREALESGYYMVSLGLALTKASVLGSIVNQSICKLHHHLKTNFMCSVLDFRVLLKETEYPCHTPVTHSHALGPSPGVLCFPQD